MEIGGTVFWASNCELHNKRNKKNPFITYVICIVKLVVLGINTTFWLNKNQSDMKKSVEKSVY